MTAYALEPFYSTSSSGAIPNWVVVVTSLAFLGAAYAVGAFYVGRLVAYGGRTLGLRATSQRLVAVTTATAPGLARALVRWSVLYALACLAIIPILGAMTFHLYGLRTLQILIVLFEIPLVIDVISPLWRPSRRAWHDELAGVAVVRDQAW
jgi:hypothetical protein